MITYGKYPTTRLRRNRGHAWLRDILAENSLSSDDLILPVFVQEGFNLVTPVPSMPNVSRYSIDRLLEHISKAYDLGIKAVAIFPVVAKEKKTSCAKESFNIDNLACKAVRAIKDKIPQMGLICDVALDPYTSHGQDGLIDSSGYVLNDETIEVLTKQSVCLAESGCDIVAPSDMMDGRVGVIRKSLDENKMQDIAILSYAAKYASSFYGPFRDAVGSATNLGKSDKKNYQMNPTNSVEALQEVQMDINEGADIVMVKPGLPYLDIIKDVSANFNIPVFAYQVSGEYSMIMAANQNGWVDGDLVLNESLIALKRAGASAILTYGALEVCKLLQTK